MPKIPIHINKPIQSVTGGRRRSYIDGQNPISPLMVNKPILSVIGYWSGDHNQGKTPIPKIQIDIIQPTHPLVTALVDEADAMFMTKNPIPKTPIHIR